MEKLLKYFMEDTGKKIDQLNEDLHLINVKLEDLRAFKIEMMSSAKMTSLIMSAIMGIVSFGATILTVIYMVKK